MHVNNSLLTYTAAAHAPFSEDKSTLKNKAMSMT
jgi:hypothetical protein